MTMQEPDDASEERRVSLSCPSCRRLLSTHSPLFFDRRTRCTRRRHLSICSHLQNPYWKNSSTTLAADCVTKPTGLLNWDTCHWRSQLLRSKFHNNCPHQHRVTLFSSLSTGSRNTVSEIIFRCGMRRVMMCFCGTCGNDSDRGPAGSGRIRGEQCDDGKEGVRVRVSPL